MIEVVRQENFCFTGLFCFVLFCFFFVFLFFVFFECQFIYSFPVATGELIRGGIAAGFGFFFFLLFFFSFFSLIFINDNKVRDFVDV